MSAPSEAIVDIEGEAATPPGHDRRRGVALVFALCLAVGSATVGRDGPAATAPDPTAPVDPPRMLIASRGDGFGQCVVVTLPDRPANETVTNLPSVAAYVGATEVPLAITSEAPLESEAT